MAITNKWTNPLSRSFQDIKRDMLSALQSITGPNNKPLITDISEGNILVLILSLFSAIAEVLHFYIDNMARECFISTARRYSSVVKQGLLVDYHPRGANAATVDVILTRELSGENSNSSIRLPKGTSFTDTMGNHWESIRDVVWDNKLTSIVIPLIQHELYNNSVLNGTIINSSEQSLVLDSSGLGGKYIEQNSVSLKLGDDNWVQVDTFAYSGPTDKHFMVVLDDSDVPTIVFGDGKFGAKPTVGSMVSVSFYITSGDKGNITANAITQAPSVAGRGVTCNNPYAAGDGMGYEDIELLRKHISLHARTMSVAITKQDFIDCAKLVPGVKEASLEYLCGRKLDLYISPVNGGIASSSLVNQVKSYLENHAPLTTWLSVYAAGISHITLDIDVTGKPSFHSDEIQSSILRALYEAYSSEKAQIGGKVRVSDIYALIDNLPEVDFLYIKKFYVTPWPKLIYGDTQLNFKLDSIDKANGSMKYILSFKSDKEFSIYSAENRFELTDGSISNGSITVDDTINGFNFSFTIEGTYNKGYKYEITISEPNHDYEEPGFNQVVFDDNRYLTLNINETV